MKCPTQVSAKYLKSGSLEENATLLELYFGSRVEKKTIDYAYGATDFIVEVGSSLGLWLGLSVIGLFDATVVLIGILKGFREKI